MSSRVKIISTGGPISGQALEFEAHDIVLFGRAPDCQICLPQQDATASRHHFILEVNPPEARLRDLGSLNGTYVNGVRQGGRERGETPEAGAAREYPQVDLHDGDVIQVGQHVLKVEIEVNCSECGARLPLGGRQRYARGAGISVCDDCYRASLPADGKSFGLPQEPPRCVRCGRDVSDEVNGQVHEDYVCAACRRALAKEDPQALLVALVEKLALGRLSQVPKFADYAIERQLGVGGFGAVYLARHRQSGSRVALKVMLAQVDVNAAALTMFEREIEVARKLCHPHLVELLDYGSAGKAFYFTMEFCEGGNLTQLGAANGGRVPLRDAAPLMLQALEGLAYMHDQGFVHRDLKPENILLAQTDRGRVVKIADFGLSKGFTEAGLSGMTATGSYAGTWPYMPKEQLTNFKYVKPVSDVWSIGAAFYVMLTGQLPRDGRRGQDPMELILRGQPVPIRQRDRGIPPAVAEVVDHALAVDTQTRYQTAGEMLQALTRVL